MVICRICFKECANDFGLKAHMRSHKEATMAEPAEEQSPEPVKAAEPPKPAVRFVKVAEKGDFTVMAEGDVAVLEDRNGKRLSKPMPVASAVRLMERFATMRR